MSHVSLSPCYRYYPAGVEHPFGQIEAHHSAFARF